jgi:hypothetical protein
MMATIGFVLFLISCPTWLAVSIWNWHGRPRLTQRPRVEPRGEQQIPREVVAEALKKMGPLVAPMDIPRPPALASARRALRMSKGG